MVQGARIKRNSLFAFLSRLIRLLTNFVMFVGIARFYGIESFGQFTTAHTLSTIFLLLADFGFDSLLPTEIAAQRDRAGELARRYFSMKIIFAVGACLLMLVLPLFQVMSAETRVLVQIFSVYVLFAALNNFFFALFKAFEEFHHETIISFYTNVVLLLLLVVLGFLHAPVYFLAVCFVGTRVIGIAMGLKTASRLTQGRVINMNFQGWREIWKHVVVFGLHFIFGALFFQVDTILLAFWRGDRDVGIYQSAFKISTMALIIPDIAINTMLPVLARLRNDGGNRWDYFGRLLNKTLFLLSLPISMMLFVYAEQIIEILYGGGEYGEAAPILRLFAITVFIRYGFETYGLMLTTSYRQKHRLTIVVCGTILNCLMNAFVIPMYGPFGAAIVSLVTNFTVGAAFVLASGRSFVEWTCNVRNLSSLVIIVLLGVAAWSIRMIPLWYIMPVVLILSAVTLYYVGYTREEWRLVFARKML